MKIKLFILIAGLGMLLVMGRGFVAISQPQCESGFEPILTRLEGNLQYYKCVKNDPVTLPEYKSILEEVGQSRLTFAETTDENGNKVTRRQCNYFVGLVGEKRDVPYFRDIKYSQKPANDVGGRDDDDRKANEIYGFISKAVASKASGWIQVTDLDLVQKLADQGRFVIGVAKSNDPAKHGHVSVVVPREMAQSNDFSACKQEDHKTVCHPWVRDNVAFEESRRANYQFNKTTQTPPIYAVWAPGAISPH